MSRQVTVITPTYNRSHYLEESIKSVYNQKYRPIEHIIVDDASTDNTSNIIKKLQKKYNSESFVIKYFLQEKCGASKSRNKGIEEASSDFILFLDSDDYLKTSAISHLMSVFNENIDCVFGDVEFINEKSGLCGIYRSYSNFISSKQLVCLLKNGINTSCVMHRKRNLILVGGFDTLPCGQEMSLHVKLMCHGVKFYYTPSVIYCFRLHCDENRISNFSWVEKDPYRMLYVNKTLYHTVKNASISDIEVDKALAYRIWEAGRLLFSLRKKKIAFEYFNYAKNIYPAYSQMYHPRYQKIVKFFGVSFFEYLYWNFINRIKKFIL